jgi:hypothetical protein
MKKLLLIIIIPCLSFGQCDYDCNNPEACNYSPNALSEEWCSFPPEYYNCFGDCLNDVDNDGICDELESTGCTDENACNYNPESVDDCEDFNEDGVLDCCEYIGDECGSLIYSEVGQIVHVGVRNATCECVIINGCTDVDACNLEFQYENCNYFIPINTDCFYPGETVELVYADCSGGAIEYACEEVSEECQCCYRYVGGCMEYICGCMDEDALNYDSNAILSNNSCIYQSVRISEKINKKNLISTIDILGRETTNKSFQLHIYDDGSVEKKYLIK